MSSQCAYPGLSSTPSHAGTDQLSPFRPRNVIVSRCVLSFGNRTIHYSDNHNKTRLAHSAPMNYGRFASSGLGVGTIQSGITAATFFFFFFAKQRRVCGVHVLIHSDVRRGKI
jgi:hypothetical protein